MSIKNYMVKRNASIEGLREPMLSKLSVIAGVFAEYGVTAVITSGTEDFKHTAKRSAHYRGDATDWRTKHIQDYDKPRLLHSLKRRLGDDFVVLLENVGRVQEHIHIHWSPVYRPKVQERGA